MAQLTTGLLSVLSLLAVGLAIPVNTRIVGRDVPLLSPYGYIVVGGGTSGLVVTNRLTEDMRSKPPRIFDDPFIYMSGECQREYIFVGNLTLTDYTG